MEPMRGTIRSSQVQTDWTLVDTLSKSDEEDSSGEDAVSSQDEAKTKHVQFLDEEYLNSNQHIADLFSAAQEGTLQEIRNILRSNVEIDVYRDEEILNSDVESVRLLLQRQANEQLSVTDPNGFDAIFLAMKNRKLEIIKLLHGEYQVQLKREAGGKTSMHLNIYWMQYATTRTRSNFWTKRTKRLEERHLKGLDDRITRETPPSTS
eukprot:755381-Hanusia_phi.AAC.6